MIGRLTGTVVSHEADGAVVLDVGGVGYELMMPLGTLGKVRALMADAERVSFHVHTHVREDAIVLYGFATADDRLAFRTLLSVSSVGPRTALAILSALPAAELARAVQSRSLTALVGVSGVGKKTAERLLLELQDKLTFAAAGPAPSPAARASGPVVEQLIDALARMGFKAGEAERAVASLGDRVQREPLDRVFRDALALLQR